MTTTNSSGSRQARGSDFSRRAWLAALFAGLAALAPVPAFAQQDGAVLRPVVLIVDMQRLQRDTAAAQNIREQSTKIRKAIDLAMAAREAKLREEEKELVALREELDPAAFDARTRDFEKRVFERRDFAQRETAKLQAALTDAGNRLRKQIAPILAEIMRERQAQVLLDSSQVVLSINQLEITEEVIRRLDKAVPTIPLSMAPPQDGVSGTEN